MPTYSKLVFILSLLIISTRPVPISAAWPPEGVLACGADASQYNHVTVEDGSGGLIIVFNDNRYGNMDIFAQRIDGRGNLLWGPDGVPVCTVTGSQLEISAVSDGEGGAVITWEDYRSGSYSDIYAQRIDANGNRQWNVSGLSVCSAANTQYLPEIVTDGSGGGIIAWEDFRNGSREIYARRVDSAGNVQWTIWGVLVCSSSSNLLTNCKEIASDGKGGAYIVWADNRNASSDIYFELVYSDGTLDHGSNGEALCVDASEQSEPKILNPAAGTALIVWRDARNATYNLYAQMLLETSIRWSSNGIQVCTAAGIVGNHELCGDVDHGFIVVWRDFRIYENDIYAQRLDTWGNVHWGAGGSPICQNLGYQYHPKIVADEAGGAVISWCDGTLLGMRACAQRVDPEGNILWDENGIYLTPLSIEQNYCRIVPDGEGGAIAAWYEYYPDDPNPYSLYAQRIDRHGYTASPEPAIDSVLDVPDDQGGKVELRWTASYLDPWPYQEITYYSIWKSLSPASAMMLEKGGVDLVELRSIVPLEETGAGTRPDPVIRSETLEGITYFWELLETQPAQYYEGYSRVLVTDFTSLPTAWTYSYYQVAAHTGDPLVVWTSLPDSGYSLDNLAPMIPAGLSGEQEYSPEGLDLVWDSNSEEDLWYYALYRDVDPGFIPSPMTAIASVYDTMYFDDGWTWEEGYVYKLSAVDIHGNESGYALLLPGGVTGDDPPTPEHRDYLSQNWPNPFNPSTTIQFGIREGMHVRLAVYDASGRLVRELIDRSLPAGDYSETWDGANSSGQPVSSGVYFYRIDADGFTTQRKMILLR